MGQKAEVAPHQVQIKYGITATQVAMVITTTPQTTLVFSPEETRSVIANLQANLEKLEAALRAGAH